MISLLPLLFACWSLPSEVELTGTLLDARDGIGLPEAGIEVHDAKGEPFGQGQTGEDGAFAITVPASQAFFVTFTDQAGDHVPTSFTGIAGSADLQAEEGLLYMRSVQEIEDVELEFANCPELGATEALIEGEVRIYFSVEGDEELPTVPDVTVTAWDLDDRPYPGCYLDEKGLSSADATATASNGRFAIFGAPTGPLAVSLTWVLAEGLEQTNWYLVRAPEGGVVPMYPAWVESP